MLYRLTDMKSEPQYIPLRTVSHATTSVTAKMLAATSYFNDSVNNALVNENDQPSEIEDLLRH